MAIEHAIEANKHRIPVQIYLDPEDYNLYQKRAKEKELSSSSFWRWVLKKFLHIPAKEDPIKADIKMLKQAIKKLHELYKSKPHN